MEANPKNLMLGIKFVFPNPQNPAKSAGKNRCLLRGFFRDSTSDVSIFYHSLRRKVLTIHIMKTAKNRGNSRIWLEGKKLSDNGFQRGDMLQKTESNNFILFTRVSNPIAGQKYHRIAGTENRPILDCCGKWVTEFMNGAANYRVEIIAQRGTILINPVYGE